MAHAESQEMLGQVEGAFDMLQLNLPTCDSGYEIQSRFRGMYP